MLICRAEAQTDHTGIENTGSKGFASFVRPAGDYLPAKDTLDGQAKVIYRSKDGRRSKIFEALDWLAQLVTHIPNKGEQTVRYYGYYSNKSRGMRKKAGTDDQVPALIASAVSSTITPIHNCRLSIIGPNE